MEAASSEEEWPICDPFSHSRDIQHVTSRDIMTPPPFWSILFLLRFYVKIAKHNVSFVFFVILRKSSKWEILDENFSLLKFSPHELDILGILQVVRALRERGEQGRRCAARYGSRHSACYCGERLPRRSLRHGRHQHDSIPITASSRIPSVGDVVA